MARVVRPALLYGLSARATRSLARVPLRRFRRRADAHGLVSTRLEPPPACATAPPGAARGGFGRDGLGAPGFSQTFRPARPPPLHRQQRLVRGAAKAAPALAEAGAARRARPLSPAARRHLPVRQSRTTSRRYFILPGAGGPAGSRRVWGHG